MTIEGYFRIYRKLYDTDRKKFSNKKYPQRTRGFAGIKLFLKVLEKYQRDKLNFP